MTKQIILLSLIVETILVMSSLTVLITSVTPASAQVQAGPIPAGDRAARNWEYINHDSWSSNYNPQTEVNKDTVKLLELKWIYPFPAGTSAGVTRRLPGAVVQEGSIAPSLFVDGTIYSVTNARDVYSFDLDTGKTNWINNFEYDVNAAKARNPALGQPTAHIHGMNYGNGLLWTNNLWCLC